MTTTTAATAPDVWPDGWLCPNHPFGHQWVRRPFPEITAPRCAYCGAFRRDGTKPTEEVRDCADPACDKPAPPGRAYCSWACRNRDDMGEDT